MLVRVYCPTKSSMQSGRGRIGAWLLEPDLLTAREPDHLMGWGSSSDTLGEIKGKLRFDTKEAALAFAKQRGWECEVDEPTSRTVRPRNYLDNFRITRPEDEERKLASAK